MTRQYANFDDDHVPAPSDHAPRTHAFRDGETLAQDARLIIAGFADREAGFERADGRWIACHADDVAEVRA